MKKVLIDEPPLEKLYLRDLVDALQSGEKIIVFYRANNKPTGIPAFLKMNRGKYRFESMMPSYLPTYDSDEVEKADIASLYYYLKNVSRSRTLYVATADEMKELFNILDEES